MLPAAADAGGEARGRLPASRGVAARSASDGRGRVAADEGAEGIDEELRKDGVVKEVVGMLERSDYDMFQQYEGALMPLRRYCKSSQSTEAIGHEELFMGRQCIELLKSSFFVMYENISRKMGDKGGKDLTVSVTPIFYV